MKSDSESSQSYELDERIAVLVILVLAGLLRFIGIGEWWLNPDEGIYYHTVLRPSFLDVWKASLPHLHPPLYYFELYILGMVSESIVWLRTLSALCGSFAVIPAYLIGKQIADKRCGYFAALILSATPASIVFSQVIRPYALLLFLLLLAYYYFLRYQTNRSTKDLRWHCIWLSISIFVHYSAVLFGLVSFTTLILHLFLGRLPSDQGKAILRQYSYPLMSVVFLALAHGVFVLSNQHLVEPHYQSWLKPHFIHRWQDIPFSLLSLPIYLFGGVSLLAAGALILIGVHTDLKGRSSSLSIPLLLGLCLALILSALGLYPFGGSRHSLYLFVFILPLMALGAHRIMSFTGRYRTIGPLCILGLLAVDQLLRYSPPTKQLFPLAPFESEHKERYSDLTAAQEVLQPILAQEGVILADEQSFYTFRPLLPLVPLDDEQAATARIYYSVGKQALMIIDSWLSESEIVDPDLEILQRTLSILESHDYSAKFMSLDEIYVLVANTWTKQRWHQIAELSDVNHRAKLVWSQGGVSIVRVALTQGGNTEAS